MQEGNEFFSGTDDTGSVIGADLGELDGGVHNYFFTSLMM
jgi:hypothetical protein